MISEGSCDTEDWSNDAENSTLPSQEYTILKCVHCFYSIFDKKRSIKNQMFEQYSI